MFGLYSVLTSENSYFQGNVSGNRNVGGIFGYGGYGCYFDCTRDHRILNSYTTATIKGNENVGGLIGYRDSNYILENSYYNSDNINVSKDIGNEDQNNFGRTTKQLQQKSTYEGWDFDNVWEMKEGEYPTLRNIDLVQPNVSEKDSMVTEAIPDPKPIPKNVTLPTANVLANPTGGHIGIRPPLNMADGTRLVVTIVHADTKQKEIITLKKVGEEWQSDNIDILPSIPSTEAYTTIAKGRIAEGSLVTVVTENDNNEISETVSVNMPGHQPITILDLDADEIRDIEDLIHSAQEQQRNAERLLANAHSDGVITEAERNQIIAANNAISQKIEQALNRVNNLLDAQTKEKLRNEARAILLVRVPAATPPKAVEKPAKPKPAKPPKAVAEPKNPKKPVTQPPKAVAEPKNPKKPVTQPPKAVTPPKAEPAKPTQPVQPKPTKPVTPPKAEPTKPVTRPNQSVERAKPPMVEKPINNVHPPKVEKREPNTSFIDNCLKDSVCENFYNELPSDLLGNAGVSALLYFYSSHLALIENNPFFEKLLSPLFTNKRYLHEALRYYKDIKGVDVSGQDYIKNIGKDFVLNLIKPIVKQSIANMFGDAKDEKLSQLISTATSEVIGTVLKNVMEKGISDPNVFANMNLFSSLVSSAVEENKNNFKEAFISQDSYFSEVLNLGVDMIAAGISSFLTNNIENGLGSPTALIKFKVDFTIQLSLLSAKQVGKVIAVGAGIKKQLHQNFEQRIDFIYSMATTKVAISNLESNGEKEKAGKLRNDFKKIRNMPDSYADDLGLVPSFLRNADNMLSDILLAKERGDMDKVKYLIKTLRGAAQHSDKHDRKIPGAMQKFGQILSGIGNHRAYVDVMLKSMKLEQFIED